MTGRIEGKVALITGAASGIGLATVELFAAQGARIVAADIQDDKGHALERRYGGQVRYAHCNVMSEAEVAATVAVAASSFGGLDILFNNAGVSDTMFSVSQIDATRWSELFDLLVRGPMLGIKHATPHLLARGGGSIINMASIAASQAGWGTIAYSTAKAAVMQLTRSVAAELSPQNIRVNAICPGMIATSIIGASFNLPDDVRDSLAAHVAGKSTTVQPIPKAGMPYDIAQAALYLASDESLFVSGTHLTVDGGATIGSRHSWDPTASSPLTDLLQDALTLAGDPLAAGG